MSWRDRIADPQTIDHLLETRRFQEALDTLAAKVETDALDTARFEVKRAAALYWLGEADVACRGGNRKRMNAAMTQAARFHDERLRSAFVETRRRIRDHTLSLTIAPHWQDLLEAAATVRNRLYTQPEAVPAAFDTFANRSLVGTMDAEAIEALSRDALESTKPALKKAYPSSLHDAVDAASPEFVRAALWVAAGRPDLAVPALLELPDNDALVCLERARAAYAMGKAGTTMLALGDFSIHHGNHETVRRLNTGVFMAQMADMAGDKARAVEILERIPQKNIGRRPVLLLARLYGETDQSARGCALLDAWLEEHPEDIEAAVLRRSLGPG